MKNSIVIFGPANVGKSTLIGYLKSKLDPNFDINNFVEKLSNNPWFSLEEKYRYITDSSIKERIRQKDNSGQTRHMHTNKIMIGNNEIIMIDTPGAEHEEKERIKGISFGDVGIFMIEFNQLLEDNYFDYEKIQSIHHFLTPYYIWKKLKGTDRLIVVLSKIDLSNYDYESYNKVKRNLRMLCNNSKINPIPISIDRFNDSDCNILDKCEKIAWHKQDCLYQQVERMATEVIEEKDKEKKLFIKLDKNYVIKGHGAVWRCKIIDGDIFINDTLKIGPVKYKNNIIPFIEFSVHNLKREKGSNVKEASAGELIGINPNNIKYSDRSIQKTDFLITDATIICNLEAELSYGNLIKFNIPIEEKEKLTLSLIVTIIWFGKMIALRVIHIENRGKSINVICTIMSDKIKNIVLPFSNNMYFYSEFLLKNQRNEFISATIIELGFLKEYQLYIKNVHSISDVIKEEFHEYEYEFEKKYMVIKHTANVYKLYEHVYRFNNKYLNTLKENIEYNILISREAF